MSSNTNVLHQIKRIFERIHAKEDGCNTELKLLRDYCEGIVCGFMNNVDKKSVRVCEFSKMQFPKVQLERCAQHIPVR